MHQHTKEQLAATIAKLRILLIVLTTLQAAYLTIFFTNVKLSNTLDINYHANKIIWLLNVFTAATFIWFNWKKLPIEKNKKTNNTLMIIFLGLIGMWLFIPNKRELDKM